MAWNDNLAGVLARRQQGCQSMLSFKHAAASCTVDRLALDSMLRAHRGCVNYVQFNDTGDLGAILLQTCCRRSETACILMPRPEHCRNSAGQWLG